ncbi:hypothetical protein M0R72_12825 [Candidatus Pacearchaeota archaeon]|jgi:hypothetical protein|nr:hypothetical protein [Candidatus Pacearchaeota archaeon]
MSESYSNALIKFGLRHYIDIASGNPPLKKAADQGFVKSAGRKNPNETFNIWLADIQRAIASLAKDDLWSVMVRDVGFEIMRASLHKLPPVQKHLIKHCIFGECYYCQSMKDCPEEKYGDRCDESHSIGRMRRFLNGEPDNPGAMAHQAALARGKGEIAEAVSSPPIKRNAHLTTPG